MKTPTLLTRLLVAGSLAVSSHAVTPHEPADPKFGGMIVVAGDLDFEIVARADSVTLHVEDHGELVSTAGASGRLMVTSGARKLQVDLVPAPPNMLVARGIQLRPGDNVIAEVSLARPADLTLRFTTK